MPGGGSTLKPDIGAFQLRCHASRQDRLSPMESVRQQSAALPTLSVALPTQLRFQKADTALDRRCGAPIPILDARVTLPLHRKSTPKKQVKQANIGGISAG
jgi:hypothetical protein